MMRNLLLGTAAGLASALLFASILTGSMLALALCFLSPLPIMIVALGWAHRAGLTAALVATAILGGALGPLFGLAFALTTAGPAWLLSYLAMLGRREGDRVVEWFPVGQVIAIAGLIGASVAILSALSIGLTLEAYTTNVRHGLDAMFRSVTGTPEGSALVIPDVDDPAALIDVFAFVFPLFSAATWIYTTLFNLWLAGRIVRTSGRLARPWPDLPAMRLPRWALLAGVAALAVCFAPGMAGLCGRIGVAAMATPFTILGYASVHDLTRSLGARPAILGVLYALTFVLNWIMLVVMTVFGVIDHLFDLRGRRQNRRRPADDKS
jgi:hypothetical protein